MGKRAGKTSLKVAPIEIDLHGIMADKVEVGVTYGVQRAYKYTSKPDEATIIEAIHNAVMNELANLFVWGDE